MSLRPSFAKPRPLDCLKKGEGEGEKMDDVDFYDFLEEDPNEVPAAPAQADNNESDKKEKKKGGFFKKFFK